jgi:hypothetical protein
MDTPHLRNHAPPSDRCFYTHVLIQSDSQEEWNCVRGRFRRALEYTTVEVGNNLWKLFAYFHYRHHFSRKVLSIFNRTKKLIHIWCSSSQKTGAGHTTGQRILLSIISLSGVKKTIHAHHLPCPSNWETIIICSLIFWHLYLILIYILCLHFLFNGFQRLFPVGLGHNQPQMLTNDLECNVSPPSCSLTLRVR